MSKLRNVRRRQWSSHINDLIGLARAAENLRIANQQVAFAMTTTPYDAEMLVRLSDIAGLLQGAQSEYETRLKQARQAADAMDKQAPEVDRG